MELQMQTALKQYKPGGGEGGAKIWTDKVDSQMATGSQKLSVMNH